MSKATETISPIITVEVTPLRELIKDQTEIIENAVGTIFASTQRLFNARDYGETTPTLQLITSMGAHISAIQAICNKLKIQLEVLIDLEDETKEYEPKQKEESNAQKGNSINPA